MIPQGNFYFMRGFSNDNRIRIHAHVKRPLPILWNREGEFRLVHKEVVANAITTVQIVDKMSGKQTHPIVCIYWDQGVPIENQVGNLLMGGLTHD